MSDTPPVTEPVDVPDPASGEGKDWQAEAEKWKTLSQKHEKNWKTASDELSTIRAASMSEAEKAIEAAKAEGRLSALSEVGDRLTEAELKVQAAKAGIDLPDNFTEVLNLSKLSKDGQPDGDAIARVIGSFNGSKEPDFPKVGGIGPQHGTPSGQLKESDLKKMTYAEINQARRDGRLNNLLGIE